jgi:hypothetical protein
MANAAPRCGARSKRTGKPCRAAAMPNGRCKVHGGKSTGPRTPEGLERSRRANWKHGYYSREAKAERSRVRAGMLVLRYLHILKDDERVKLVEEWEKKYSLPQPKPPSLQ